MTSYTYDHLELGDENSLGCQCCRWKKGIDLPVPKKLLLGEVAVAATRFSASIFSDFAFLNAATKRFEAIIQKRWLKKNAKQRRELLLKAWPNMPQTHRPDFASFRNSRKLIQRSRTLSSDAYLWPYINLEDLEQKDLLLLFLHSRSVNMPDKFAHTDAEAAHLGPGWYQPIEQDMRVMQLQGQHSPRRYGSLIECNPGRKERVTMLDETCAVVIASHVKRSGLKVQLKLGLVTLEIQQGIYAFLASCTKLILHDVEPSQFFVAAHQPPPCVPKHTSSEWPSLASLQLEVPYRLPQQVDLERLKGLVTARKAASEDHLWMLREDPGYFVDALKEWREHDRQALMHICDTCWRNVTMRVITDAFSMLLYWDHIYRIFESMPSMEMQLRRANSATLRMNKFDEFAWSHLVRIIDTVIHIPLGRLLCGVPPSPRMRHCYVWSRDEHDHDFATTWTTAKASKGRSRMENHEYRVDSLFHAITDENLRRCHKLNNLVQEVQYMIDTDAKASVLVDAWISSQFADLAMLSELKQRIESLLPWSLGWKVGKVHESQAMKDTIKKVTDLEEKVCESIAEGCGLSPELFDPFHESWTYPATKAKTEANVKQMQLAEAKLDLLWGDLDNALHRRAQLCLTKVIDNRLIKPRKLYRTPDWMPSVVPQKKKAPLTELDVNIPHFGLSTTSPAVQTPHKVKDKVKTRGVAASPPNTDHVNFDTFDSDPEEDAGRLIVRIGKRAYKVLSALLPEPGADNHQRVEIAWDELLQAMNHIGFQPMKLYGSVWIFRPKASSEYKLELRRSFQLHEPKECRTGSKIPANMVRTFGRRLKHAYGWEGGMFVCE